MKFVSAFICFFLILGNLYSQTSNNEKVYKIWDDQPAPNRGADFKVKKAGGLPYDADWELKSYPLGNGYMGANFFGRTDTERIQITEKTLLNRGLYGLGSLTNFAEIFLEFNHQHPENYSRSLNINEAIANIKHSSNGVNYHREYFVSYPDKVMVIKLSANKQGKISFKLKPELPYVQDSTEYDARSGIVIAKGDVITLSGTINYYSLNYEAQIKVINDGGKISAVNDNKKGEIVVTDANSVVLLIATGTNYELSEKVISENTKKQKLDITVTPHKQVSKTIESATKKGYAKLKEAHLTDYQNLFSRVSLNLDSEVPDIKTESLLENYKAGAESRYLEELMFQYGRYLLIASSRKGALPSGLQGVWSQYLITPWTGGYWHNINIQMNYWGAFNANLAETFTPYVEYFEVYFPEASKLATKYIQRHNPNAIGNNNGWTIGTGANPYEIQSPGGHSGPGTGGFTSKLFWEYYDFTRDTTYLRESGYPALLGMSQFLAKTLKPSDDGKLLVDPSASPEQMLEGRYYTTKGTTFDQGFVWENHNDLLKAAEILKIEDSFLDEVKIQLPLLDPILIGKSGQIKEYREEIYYSDIGDENHRHISHLCPLYPGTLVNSTTPSWIDAAKVTLDLRGNNTTGWAMAHRMNLRARTKEGNKAYEVYSKFIKERTLPNLWTTHPPFQIDGSFGCMAGVAEMLIQSHEDYIEPLAALPATWKNGEFKGLVARGNFEVSAKWKNQKATSFEVLSKSGGKLVMKYPAIAKAQIKDNLGNDVPFEQITPNIISMTTQKGASYFISYVGIIIERSL